MWGRVGVPEDSRGAGHTGSHGHVTMTISAMADTTELAQTPLI